MKRTEKPAWHWLRDGWEAGLFLASLGPLGYIEQQEMALIRGRDARGRGMPLRALQGYVSAFTAGFECGRLKAEAGASEKDAIKTEVADAVASGG